MQDGVVAGATPKRRAVVYAALFGGLSFLNAAWGDAYSPPTNYYATATGTGATLKHNLYTLTKTGFVQHNYGDARYTLNQLWADPNNSANTLLIYTQTSVSGTWDGGVTWNREHMVPEYTLGISGIQNSNSTYGADEFDLAPANPDVNSTRSNDAYGYTGSASTPSATTYGKVTGTDGNTYWDVGTEFEGDAARSAFYMATRYGEGQGTGSAEPKNAYNLTIANGTLNNTGTMGDLNTLLHWAYEDPVDTFERRKNQLVYTGMSSANISNGATGAASQGNRNPYIDHPEYIWAVFGTSANNSQISVVSTVGSTGASSTAVNLGRVIAGTAFSTSSVAVNKTGTTPTTFDVTTAGNASSTMTGTGETFDYNAGAKTMTVGLTTSPSAGLISGSVTIHNTDLTSAGTGDGSADGDDTVSVTGTALDHSVASFTAGTASKTLTLSFGTLTQNSGLHALGFSIMDLLTASGYTAGLDLDSISGTGSTSTLYTNLSTFSDEAAGTPDNFVADLNSATVGNYSAQYTLAVSDENMPGAIAGQSLILNLSGTIVAVPEPGSTILFAIASLGLSRRSRRKFARGL